MLVGPGRPDILRAAPSPCTLSEQLRSTLCILWERCQLASTNSAQRTRPQGLQKGSRRRQSCVKLSRGETGHRPSPLPARRRAARHRTRHAAPGRALAGAHPRRGAGHRRSARPGLAASLSRAAPRHAASRSSSSRRLATCPNWRWMARSLRRRVVDGIMELLREARRDDCLIWAHNLGLGRNLYLARELTFTCHCAGIPLIAHHHDWWFENRWHHFAAMREPGFRTLPAVASAVLAGSPRICHVAINHADAAVLEKHFPGLAGWLPNPVEPAAQPPAARVEAARAWLREQLGEDAPVWLLPCRLLRRKNIAEALLLTRWLRPEAWLVTTGGVSSAEEQALRGRPRCRRANARLAAAPGHPAGRRKPEAVRAGTAGRQRSRPAHLASGRLRPALPRSGGGPASARGATSCPTSRRTWRSSDSPSRSAIGKCGWTRRCSTGAASASARPACSRSGRA